MSKRQFTNPAVTEFPDRFIITRIADPDDEYATTQVLTPGGWFDEESYPRNAYEFQSPVRASEVLRAYLVGFDDGWMRAATEGSV